MAQIHQPNFQIVYNDARLAGLFQSLDELHTAASEGHLATTTPLNHAELVGWLQELIYVAEQTIVEIEDQEATTSPPHLRIVK
jgi:gluconate kinase